MKKRYKFLLLCLTLAVVMGMGFSDSGLVVDANLDWAGGDGAWSTGAGGWEADGTNGILPTFTFVESSSTYFFSDPDVTTVGKQVVLTLTLDVLAAIPEPMNLMLFGSVFVGLYRRVLPT